MHAWEEWGERCVERFRGMFAFALWDRNRESLFLARDRLGVKPLHYAMLPDGMVLFGSELKSMLAHGGMARDIDPLRDRGILRAGLRRRAAHDLQGGAKAAAGAHAAAPPRPAGARAARVLGRALHRRAARVRRRSLRGARRAAARVGPAADDLRGSARRIPVRRRRFERRRRADGGAVRRARQHLLDRLRRSGVQRVRVRAGGRGPLPHEPPRRARRVRRLRSRSTRSRRCTTSPTPTARRSRPIASASSRAST